MNDEKLYTYKPSGATLRKLDLPMWREYHRFEVVAGEMRHDSMIWREGTRVWLRENEVEEIEP